MATTLTNTTFNTSFKDDFADSANFHKILFNSGRAVQARELTQLQTILQNQITRFGNNIFKEGAVVKPGGASINQKYEFIKLDTTTNALPTDTSTLIGITFSGSTSAVSFKVLQVVAATGSDPATLYVQYLSAPTGLSGNTAVRVTAGENITGGSETLTVQTTNTTANPAVGVGILITLLSGIYYARGHFVFTQDQSKIISKYSDSVNANVGFKVVESVVTAVDDTSLFDNQGATPNLTAPGADRYKINLTIAEESEINSDENFVHVATVKEGVVYSAVTHNDSYNIPNKVVAKRIFENSGDYIVKPFKMKFNLDSANTHLNLEVSPGTAVVEGFRASRDFPTTLRLQKATDTITIENDATNTDFGNFVLVDNSTFGDSATIGLPNIHTFEKLDLRDSVDYLGSTIGTARVKAINEDGNNLRFHLFDIRLNSGNAFRNVKSIGTSTSSYFRPTLENGKAVLKETEKNRSLFQLPRQRPQSVTDVSFAAQRRFVVASNPSGQASLSLSAPGEKFTNADDWIVGTDSDIFLGASFSIPPAGTSVTITNLPASTSLEILAYVNKSQATIKNKVLTTRTITIGIDSDGNGQKFVPLKRADIFDVQEILKGDDSSVSFANRFTLDDGQRDNHYDLGRLLLNPGQSAPPSTPGVFVKYRHFEHGVSGDFFAVNSYTGQVTYDQIPRYRFSNGRRIRLYDFLDFRSTMDSGGEFADQGTGGRVIELPQPTQLITADVAYYVPKAGKLVIDKDGIIRVEIGTSGFNPSTPLKPSGTLALYDFRLNANTLNDSDVVIKKIDHKRFTMKDIAQLERRVDKLEEFASLNSLELDTKNFQVLDSAGNDRTKAGFFVDNFNSSLFSDTSTNNYRAALDPIENVVRPAFTEDNIRLIFDSDTSLPLGTVRRGDNIYIDYDEAPYINQDLATKSIKINPFSVVIYEGVLTLSPASDEWRSVEIRTEKTVPGGIRLNTKQAYNWNNWSWNWGGIPLENLQVGSSTGQISGVVNKVVSDETVLEVIEDRVIQSALIPFARPRKVFFKAEGLRPTTKMFAFLDGNNITALSHKENFQFYSDYDSDFGNTLVNATTHPSGNAELITDATGSVSGSFIVPFNDTIKIRTGERQFKLLDISTDNESFATSIGKAVYSMSGFLDTVDRTYESTRVLGVQGTRLRDNATYQNNSNDDGNEPPGEGINITPGAPNQTGPGTWSSSSYHDPNDTVDVGLGDGIDGHSSSSGDDNNSSDPGSSGHTDSTYICTATFNNGFITEDHFKVLKRYGVKLRKIDPYVMKAYDWYGPKIAKILGNKYSGVFLTNYYKAKRNKNKLSISQSLFDVSSRFILRPIGRIVGRLLTMKKGN